MSMINIKPKPANSQKTQVARHDTIKTNQEAIKSAALKGLLLNSHIKKENQETVDNFDKISTSLLIPEEIKKPQEANPKVETFDIYFIIFIFIFIKMNINFCD